MSILVCVPWARRSIEWSSSATCSACRCQVAIAPSGRKIVADRGADVMCIDCAELFDADVQPLTDAQRAELVGKLS